ncbi:unnamed protein product [Mytilus coruscus]|uniref:MEGF10_11 n=1 Tax=Mytilus coruscus TaxID=42192 RepID=A0A6J8ACS3_MYTCO|nr:unnamed protein product [Mytilus coruscus]
MWCYSGSNEVNLAPHGIAEQQSTLIDSEGIVHSANLAIEGPANNDWNDGCSSTQPNQPHVWWILSLPEVAYITNVEIYYRGDSPNMFDILIRNSASFSIVGRIGKCRIVIANVLLVNVKFLFSEAARWHVLNFTGFVAPDQMNDFRLYLVNTTIAGVGEVLCYTDRGIPGYPDTTQDIDCYILAKKIFFFNRYKAIELCYIAVNGCWKGTWGTNCTTDCPVECIESHCFPENGSCVWGCDVNRCFHGKCDAKTDVCTKGCVPGQGGRYCTFYNTVYNGTAKQSLSGLSSPADVLVDGLLLHLHQYVSFADGYPTVGNHKVYCSNTTDSWADGTVLYNAEYVKQGHRSCDVGKFGGKCLRDCSANCLSSPCDHVTGKCKAGCEKGWEGFNCTEECSEGHFGWGCLETCDGCIANECSHINGVCKNSSVCKPGYVYGKYCNQTCDAWHFGTNCNKWCNCLNKPCNVFTGECPNGGCKLGWTGDSCDQECSHGYFGSNCIQFCDGCFDHSCNKLNGSCNRCCKEGFMGPLCATRADSASTDSPVSTQIGLFIGGLVLGALLTLGIVVIINRRRISITQTMNSIMIISEWKRYLRIRTSRHIQYRTNMIRLILFTPINRY